ncbi:hypothetical protein Ddye_009458 [Dipteronia dyeriana]|uniref:Non-haem dioxygenase N-terminal domain-containing protein n=1 Tax=Dipteronia dyeriana TaxID=168575 RepID=A0AAD9XC18_9ROSI|nr:hypothetical protein Ddye_009458 [Dipteronia dyeriana]
MSGFFSDIMAVESVQAVASICNLKDSIPSEFIRPEIEQPAITTYHGIAPEIPTVDISDPDVEKVVALMAEASREWGIFQIVNHGIPDHVISRLQAVGRQFFELPQEEKEAYAKPPALKVLKAMAPNFKKKLKERNLGLIISSTRFGLLLLSITASGPRFLHLTGR